MRDASVLERLSAVIRARIESGARESYVADLMRRGLAKVRSKVQEEAGEVLEASVRWELGGEREPLVREAADLVFHLLVLLVAQGVEWEEVLGELERRFGVSGLEEKARRR